MLSQFLLLIISTRGYQHLEVSSLDLVANAHMHLNHHYCYYLPLLPMLRWLPYPSIPLGLFYYVHIGLDDVPFLILVIQMFMSQIHTRSRTRSSRSRSIGFW